MPSTTFRADQRFMYMIPLYLSHLLDYFNLRFGLRSVSILACDWPPPVMSIVDILT